MVMRIGLYNKNFQMTSEEMLEQKVCDVNGKPAIFKIVAGPLKWDGKPLTQTYVLEIHYRGSEEAHRRELPLEGFSSHLYADYAEQAHKLAQEFCEQHDLVINTPLNSWPEYQAVVSKKKVT
jgi:hypothetical protein